MPCPPVFRFAPSPNGRLHLGHAYSALLNWDAARAQGGRFLLRIEDIDTTRARPEFERAIREDLAWLGIRWEEPARRQSEHFADYRAALDRLKALGAVYPCRCTRGEIARATATRTEREGRAPPLGPDGQPVYPGTCRDHPAAPGEAVAWRLRCEGIETPAAHRGDPTWEVAVWGDVVVARRDIPTSYHLAVVVDDALQGVTDVIRGADLEAATAIHRRLQALLGLPSPRYTHHRLVLDEGGEKLAKSRGSPALADLRAAGETPETIRARLGLPPAIP